MFNLVILLQSLASAGLRDAFSCPLSIPLSCSNSTPVADSCCFEYPNGAILQTQFWDYSPATGPDDLFTLHGLWPDTCSGGYNQYCNPSWEISGSDSVSSVLTSFGETDLLTTMQRVWKNLGGDDESLWLHEYNKHGTCMNTLSPSCYSSYTQYENAKDFFKIAVATYNKLPTYEWLKAAGITPSTTQTYTKLQIEAALTKNYGHSVYISCDSSNALNEVWYFYHVQGSIMNQNFVSIDSLNTSGCSASGIKFLPKTSSASTKTTGTTTTKTTTGATTTGTASSSTGFVTLTGNSGCLISNGKWYTTGTCATFTLEAAGSGYRLKTSKGYCSVDTSSGALSCASTITTTTATIFGYDTSSKAISLSGNTAWSAASTASGSAQVLVYAGNSYSVDFQLQFS
ncbi:hypothetical protein BABINDRAFT_178650 [Babjeviella inositovora NRRL Y-12698]|uniref:Ribonuclease T2-like n=1 Tax=Babjeviella inositovora NRRL Y-12698 TaxID=984486 RepID=A0A1E3QX87_9ASCO|nr:uncharacterized protein BABINDRAFT_178650 [Babjeviella inositovora NRRL Y-12698]ODQ82308.1 hypothetical protein BABINDRAFT_178650 [Babjeviella inositovora NRRL Y-12698]